MTVNDADRRAALFSFGDNIPYKVTVTDPEDGTINCTDVR